MAYRHLLGFAGEAGALLIPMFTEEERSQVGGRKGCTDHKDSSTMHITGFRQQHSLRRTSCPEMALEATDGLSMWFRKRQMIQAQSCRGAIWITRTSV